MSLSLDYASQMSQYISQSIDTTVLARQITDIVRRQNFQLAADDLVKAMDISFPEHLFHVSSPFPSSEVIDRCVAALEKATPYMPDDVNREIQDTVIAPAKKKQLSVDTLLSILALVLTILIFVFEQVTGHIAQLEDEKALDALCESNQQLAGEIDELSRTIQQLTDEVGELSNCVNRLSEVTLDEKEPDREESEADSLEQVDNSQQSEPAL